MKLRPAVEVRALMPCTKGAAVSSIATRPRLDTVVVTSRVVFQAAKPRMASLTKRGAARRSGFFSSLIMAIMRRFRAVGSVPAVSWRCTSAATASRGSSAVPGV